MGPLLGVSLALGIVLIAMSVLLMDSWISVVIAAAAAVITLVVVTVVMVGIASDDENDEEPSHIRDHIPGIS